MVNILHDLWATKIAGYVESFLPPHNIMIIWDGTPRGMITMNQGAPQGSLLSLALWLLQIEHVFRNADQAIRTPDRLHDHYLRHPMMRPKTEYDLMSYVNDIKLLVITDGTSKAYRHAISRIHRGLHTAAESENLQFDTQKEAELHFNDHHDATITILRIHIDNRLCFRHHIEARLEKATKV